MQCSGGAASATQFIAVGFAASTNVTILFPASAVAEVSPAGSGRPLGPAAPSDCDDSHSSQAQQAQRSGEWLRHRGVRRCDSQIVDVLHGGVSGVVPVLSEGDSNVLSRLCAQIKSQMRVRLIIRENVVQRLKDVT